MGYSICNYVVEREIFQLLRDVKWLVIVSVLLALILASQVRELYRERREIFQLLRDVKWLVIVSVLLALILASPPQVRELYRIFVDDITFASRDDVRTNR